MSDERFECAFCEKDFDSEKALMQQGIDTLPAMLAEFAAAVKRGEIEP